MTPVLKARWQPPTDFICPIATTEIYDNTLEWRHNGRDNVSNHQPDDCLFNRLFRRRSKKTSKLRVTGLCVKNSPGTGEFPAQMSSNSEKMFPFDDVIINEEQNIIYWKSDDIKFLFSGAEFSLLTPI